MDTQILEDIGLTNAEIKVYLALLELGSSTAGPIIEKSGLQSSVVYLTLTKLVDRGFLSIIKQGKRRNYQATNPNHILNYLDEKKKRFEEILPQLMIRQQSSKQSPEITSFHGIRGIRELLYELLEAGGKSHHTINSPDKSLMMGDAFWIEYHKKRAKNGIRAELIFNESLRSWKVSKTHYNAEIRYSGEGFEPLTETIIRNDKLGIIIWTEKPVGTIIRNKVAADSYEKYFQLLWNQAKK